MENPPEEFHRQLMIIACLWHYCSKTCTVCKYICFRILMAKQISDRQCTGRDERSDLVKSGYIFRILYAALRVFRALQREIIRDKTVEALPVDQESNRDIIRSFRLIKLTMSAAGDELRTIDNLYKICLSNIIPQISMLLVQHMLDQQH